MESSSSICLSDEEAKPTPFQNPAISVHSSESDAEIDDYLALTEEPKNHVKF
jgi:hypothetical protein